MRVRLNSTTLPQSNIAAQSMFEASLHIRPGSLSRPTQAHSHAAYHHKAAVLQLVVMTSTSNTSNHPPKTTVRPTSTSTHTISPTQNHEKLSTTRSLTPHWMITFHHQTSSSNGPLNRLSFIHHLIPDRGCHYHQHPCHNRPSGRHTHPGYHKALDTLHHHQHHRSRRHKPYQVDHQHHSRRE